MLEYNFEVVHKGGLRNLDVDGLDYNLSLSQEDLTGVRWHGIVDEEAMPKQHSLSPLAQMEGKFC